MGQCPLVRHWSQTHQPKLQDHDAGQSTSRIVTVYLPAFDGTNLYCLTTEVHWIANSYKFCSSFKLANYSQNFQKPTSTKLGFPKSYKIRRKTCHNTLHTKTEIRTKNIISIKMLVYSYLEYVMNHIFLSLMRNIGMIWQALQKCTDALLATYDLNHIQKNSK